MKYLTAWQAHTGKLNGWFQQDVWAGKMTLDSTVWRHDDGSYAVGDDYDLEEFDGYVNVGQVKDWILSYQGLLDEEVNIR